MPTGLSDVADNLLNERLQRSQELRQAAFDQKVAISQAALDFQNAVDSARAGEAVSGIRAQEGVQRARFDAEKQKFQERQLAAKAREAEQPPPAQITPSGDPMRTLSSGAGIGGGAQSGVDIASMIQEAVSGGSAVQGQIHTDPGTGRVFESGQAPQTPFPKINAVLWGLDKVGVGPGATRTVLAERPDLQMQQERLQLERDQAARESARFGMDIQTHEDARKKAAAEQLESLRTNYPTMGEGARMAYLNAIDTGDLASANTILSKHESSASKLNQAQVAAEWARYAVNKATLEKTNLEVGQIKDYAASMKLYDLSGITGNPGAGAMSDKELSEQWRNLAGADNITNVSALGGLTMLQTETLRRTGVLTFYSQEKEGLLGFNGEPAKVSQLPVEQFIGLMDMANSGDPGAEEQARKALELNMGVTWVQSKRNPDNYDMDLSSPKALANPNLPFWSKARNLYSTTLVLRGKSPEPLGAPPSNTDAAAQITADANAVPQGPRNAREAGQNLGRAIKSSVESGTQAMNDVVNPFGAAGKKRMADLQARLKANQTAAREEERRRIEKTKALVRGTKAAAKGTGEFLGGIGSGLGGQ